MAKRSSGLDTGCIVSRLPVELCQRTTTKGNDMWFINEDGAVYHLDATVEEQTERFPGDFHDGFYDLNDALARAECYSEFGPHDDHSDCERMLDEMENGALRAYDPMADIPWGTPDEWIPDNPNEDGFCMRDFI